MICLGRSHYFRFNHPSEAKLMKAILPNARISMAPITFYPAVDNPEYFHMTAQEAAGSGEEIRVHNDESPPPVGREGERGSSHPPVPPRKNPPPSTLTLPLTDNSAVDTQNNKESCQTSSPESAPKSSSEEYSDSENPPEVPPRSEGTCPTYVNTTGATLLSANPKSSATYLGEYIYTKAEEDLATTTHSLKTKETASNQFAGSPTSVITHNGMTMAHNAMKYYSPRSPVGSPTACSSQLAFFNTTSQHPSVSLPSSVATSTSHSSVSAFTLNHSVSPYSSPRTPLPVTSECSPKTCSTLGGSITSPCYNSNLNSRYANLGSPVGTLEKDLKLSERKKQLAHEERLQEQAMASAEKARLEEILKMCAEYERQQNVGFSSVGSPTSSADSTSTTKSSISPYHTLTQKRIKTNGSLPREKRSPLSSPPPSHLGITSPTGSVPSLSPPISSSRRAGTPSEDELNSIFSFESDSGFNISNGANATNRSDHSCPYPPFPNLSSGLEETPSPPPISPRSPYENISHNHHLGYPMPQSPRTRIRTIVGKDRRDHCEVFENKMAFGDMHSPQTYSNNNSFTSSGAANAVARCTPKENGLTEKVPVKPPRSPRIDRNVLVGDNDLSNTKDSNIIDNKYFADVTPKAKANKTNLRNCNIRRFNDEENAKITAAKRNCLHSVTSELNSSPSRSKVFEEHMIRNIQDTLNINDIGSEVEKLKREKDEALKETVRLKGKINDLECQENEALRELELERALLEGELDCLKYSIEMDEESLSQLLKKSNEMEKRHKDDREKDKETINNCKMRLELAEKELDNVGKSEDPLSEKDLKEKSELEKQKHETLETERKVFEDTEFSQMESEALRESEREELNKEICDLKEKIHLQKEKCAELEKQMADITSSVMLHVSNVDRQMAELARLGAIPPVPNGRLSPTASSSDSEESTGNDLVDRLAQLHLLDQSQEDLDRINQIATLSPLEYREGTLGRKTSAALMEVERNRQLNLVKQDNSNIYNQVNNNNNDNYFQMSPISFASPRPLPRTSLLGLSSNDKISPRSQFTDSGNTLNRKANSTSAMCYSKEGTQVINDEKRRVEELKRKVAHKVKEEWEERRKEKVEREIACASLDSVGSEESSSLTSSDMHVESLSSDDVIAHRSSGGESAAKETKV
ncbi:Pleckstrin homology-like domain family B member 2, partial [Armadillidium nasatum]